MSESADNPRSKQADALQASIDRHTDFFNLVKNVRTKADLEQVSPKIRSIVSAAEAEANIIFQEAGNIPDGDSRHERFEKSNQILEEYKRLTQLP